MAESSQASRVAEKPGGGAEEEEEEEEAVDDHKDEEVVIEVVDDHDDNEDGQERFVHLGPRHVFTEGQAQGAAKPTLSDIALLWHSLLATMD